MSIYNFDYTSIDGQKVSMEKYKGRVLVIVNVASKCGLTPHYKGLQELYDKYHDKGLDILAFPCNQFGGQEPLSEKEIADFCTTEYKVTFEKSSKVEVRETGSTVNKDLPVYSGTPTPLYKYLTEQKPYVHDPNDKGKLATIFNELYGTSITDNQIKWNFTKFLIDRQGNVVERFEPAVEPANMESAIQKLL